ncbi:MAG: DMT family transporter [Pseudomonadota bacterium]
MTLRSLSTSPAFFGAVLMVLAGGLFAVVNTLVQHAVMVQGVPPARLAFWQYAVALACAAPWLAAKGWAALRTRVLGRHVLRVALAAGGVQLWVIGLAYVPIWQAIALVMLSPFFVTLGAALLLREHATAHRWLAVTVGFAGGMVILAPWSDAFRVEALLPVGAAALWAASSLLTKQMTRSESPETLTVYLLLLLTPINAALAVGDGIGMEIGTVGALLLAIGLLTAVAQYALVSSYVMADASFLQPFDHVKLPLNVALGIAAFGFVPPGTMWLGAMMIVGGSLYLLWHERGGK